MDNHLSILGSARSNSTIDEEVVELNPDEGIKVNQPSDIRKNVETMTKGITPEEYTDLFAIGMEKLAQINIDTSSQQNINSIGANLLSMYGQDLDDDFEPTTIANNMMGSVSTYVAPMYSTTMDDTAMFNWMNQMIDTDVFTNMVDKVRSNIAEKRQEKEIKTDTNVEYKSLDEIKDLVDKINLQDNTGEIDNEYIKALIEKHVFTEIREGIVAGVNKILEETTAILPDYKIEVADIGVGVKCYNIAELKDEE